MKLEELKKMIKEEFDKFAPTTPITNEAEDDVDVSVDDTDIDADTAGDEAGEDDVLRQIFDLLKTHFEGGDDEMGDDVDETYMEDGDEKVDEEADLEENSTTDAKFQKTGMAPMSKGSAGANVGYDTAKTTKGSTGYDAGSKALQERFKKLANIVKG